MDADISETPRVRQAGTIGKEFATTAELSLWQQARGINQYYFLSPSGTRQSTNDARWIGEVPSGTRLRIARMEYTNVLMVVAFVDTYAILETGSYSGRRVRINDFVDARFLVNEPLIGDKVWIVPYRAEALPWAEKLAKDGAVTEEAFALMVRGLQDRDWVVRYYAARGLGEMAQHREPAAAALAAALGDSDPDVLRQAMKGLWALHSADAQTLRAMVKVVAQREYASRPYFDTARLQLVLVKAGKPVVSVIGESLATADDEAFGWLLGVLRSIGKEGREAVPAVVARAKRLPGVPEGRDDPWLNPLREMPGLREEYAQWGVLLDDPDVRIRARFAYLAGVEAALPKLVTLLHDNDVRVRRGAAESLRQIKAPVQTVAAALAIGVADADLQVQQYCAEGFHYLDVAGNPAAAEIMVKALSRAANEDGGWAKTEALAGLSRLQWSTDSHGIPASFELRDAAFKALIGGLADKDEGVRRAAVAGIVELGQRPDPAHAEARVRALAGALHDRSAAVRIEALHGIGPEEARLVLPQLKEAARDWDEGVRAEARKTIERMN